MAKQRKDVGDSIITFLNRINRNMVLFHHIHYFYFSANKHPSCCSKHMKFSLKIFVYYKLADFLSKHEIVWRTGHN